MKPFLVYILQCADGSYYCGHTDDLEQRMRQHEGGGVAGCTVTRRPVTLLWKGEFEKREEAIAFERKIKGWSRGKKEALIAGDWKRVSELACSRNAPFDRLRANGGGGPDADGELASPFGGPVLSLLKGSANGGGEPGADGETS